MKPWTKRRAPLIRWSADLRQLKAISIRQPWAWLIVNGYKDVENRTWKAKYTGALLIHAGASRFGLRDAEAQVVGRFAMRMCGVYDFRAIVVILKGPHLHSRTPSHRYTHLPYDPSEWDCDPRPLGTTNTPE